MISWRMDRRITLRALVETQDATGEPVQSWSTFATVWSERRDTRGSERFQSDQVLPIRSTVFIMRWLAGVRETMTILDVDGSVYDIKGLAERAHRIFGDNR